MKAHYATLRVFCGEEEDEAKILEGLKWLVPLDFEEENPNRTNAIGPSRSSDLGIKLQRQTALGFGDRKITIFEVTLSKQRHVNAFLESLLPKISDQQRKMVIGQLESRIDDDGNFFLRLEKSAVSERKDALVTDGGNCYHIKIKIAVFPATKEKAIKAAMESFNQSFSSSKSTEE